MQNYFTQNCSSREISRFAASLFLALTFAILAGCGSGGSGGTPVDPNAPAPTTPAPGAAPTGTPAASVQLLVSSPQMPSSGASTVDLTAIVLSATKQAVSGRTVTISPGTDTTAFTNNYSASGVSDANGIVTATLNLGTNKANRTITVTATADSATATNSVDVTGTTVTISGSSSLAFGAETTLTFTVKDSAGTALRDMTVSVASQTANPIVLTPATGITNAAGQITAVVRATKAGNDTITATAAGASATQALTISADSFAFTTPAASAEIPLAPAAGSSPAVSVNWKNAGAPQVGATVTFATSRGTVAGSPAITNAAGDTPGVTVSSTTAGPAIITASGTGGTPAATLNVVFVATSASSATVQAVPGTIEVTTGSVSQATNSSTISVLVRDANSNLVKNAGVNFTITADPSGGSLTAARAITDVTGSASVTYKAGATSSPSNGVTIQATVTDINNVALPAPVINTTSLTVAGQSLLVRLGTDNLVVSNTPLPTYSKTYAAVVTDASGNPMVGATVRFALRPGTFQKGFYIAPTPFLTWVKAATPTTCPNEDLNFNGIIDLGEDTNGSGQLDPGGSAIVNATGTTDASGIANATLTYPKDHATWAQVILEARTGVVGNDPPALVTFFLPGLASDYSAANIAPPGQTSPYGRGDPLAIPAGNNDCSNTN